MPPRPHTPSTNSSRRATAPRWKRPRARRRGAIRGRNTGGCSPAWWRPDEPPPDQSRPRADVEVQPALRHVSAAGAAASVRGYGLAARRARGEGDPRQRLPPEVAARDGGAAALLAPRRCHPSLPRGERVDEWPRADRGGRREAAGVAAQAPPHLHRLDRSAGLSAAPHRRRLRPPRRADAEVPRAGERPSNPHRAAENALAPDARRDGGRFPQGLRPEALQERARDREDVRGARRE